MAGEVPAVGRVAADGEGGQLLAVEQPRLAGVADADGGQERVGRLHVAGGGAEVIDVGVRADVPVGLIGAAHPRCGDGGRCAEVQGQVAVRELHGRERWHRDALGADGGRETTQRLVGELHGRCGGAGGVQGHLDRRELGRRRGDRTAGLTVPVASPAPGPQGHEQCPGQQDSPAGQTGKDPGCVEDRVVGLIHTVVDLIGLVDTGGRRRRLLGLRRRDVGCSRLGHRGDRGLLDHRRLHLGRRVDGLLVLGAGLGLDLARLLVVGAGDGELPADVDDVRVGQLSSAGLGDTRGGLVDLGPPVGVAELLLGDPAEGVAGLHAVRVRGGVVGLRGGQLEHPSRLEKARLATDEVAVELGDLLVPGSVAEVVFGDGPQALSRLHGVVDGLGALTLLLGLDLDVLLGGRVVRRLVDAGGGVPNCRWRRGRRGDRGGLRGNGGGDEEQGGQADEAAGGGLRSTQAGQVRCLDPAEPCDGLDDEAERHEGPCGPADHLEQAEDQRAVVGGEEGVLDALQGRGLVGDRIGADGQEQDWQPDEDAEHGDRGGEAGESLAQVGAGGRGHRSMPPSARMSRADASPVTCMVSRPMIPRNLLS